MLSTTTIVAVLSINACLGGTDANTCPVSGCSADSGDSALASVLIQQVQHNSLSGPVASPGKQLAKAVVDEALVVPSSAQPKSAGHSATHKAVPTSKSVQSQPSKVVAHGALATHALSQTKSVPPSSNAASPAKLVKKEPTKFANRKTLVAKAMQEKTHKVAAGTQTSASLHHDRAVGPAPKPPSMHMRSMHPRHLLMLQMSSMHHGIARLAANVAPVTHKTERGGTAPLNENGYQAVAALKSDADMEMFIRRVIDAYDSKVVNEGGFLGIVPWFSGTTSAQSFEKLQETLLYAVLSRTQNPWLAYKNTDGTTGRNAELSFMGYVEIAASKSHDGMAEFARRVCGKLGVKVVNEPGFNSMVRFYSGEDGVQDYGKLKQEITSAANAPHTWAAWKSAEGH